MSSHKILSRAEVVELVRRIREKDDRNALNTLFESNLRLVMFVAKKFPPDNGGLQLYDLLQAGGVGLMRAIQDFNPERGCMFSTYAVWWIRQAIGHEIRKYGKIIHMPAGATNTYFKYIRIVNELTNKNFGVRPTDSEVADRMEMPIKKLRAFLKHAQGRETLSIDTPL